MPACNFLPMYQGERSASALRKLQSMARPSTIWRRKSSDKEGAHARRCRLLPHQPTAAPAPARLAPKPKCERVSGGRAHTRRWWLRLLCAAPPCGLRRHRPHPPSAGRLHRHPTRSRRPAHQPVSRAVSWAHLQWLPPVPGRPGPRYNCPVRAAGWAGRNQIYSTQSLILVAPVYHGAKRCTAQPADLRARRTGQGSAFISEHALHLNQI